MTSRLISSAQSSPRRSMTIPILPLGYSRSAGTTPRVLSPNPEVNTIIEGLGKVEITDGKDAASTAGLTGLTEETTAGPSKDTQVAIVVDEAGSPTRQDTQLRSGENTYEDMTVATTNPTYVNPISQRILNNIRGPVADFQGHAPRHDRVSQVPNANNAQGIFPPDALIFVANLSTQKAEEQLELSCHQTFDTYGANHIKIRRDKNHHPFAFVQFENVDDANAAVSGAYGLILDGRKIRIERAKAERAVILSKADGSTVTEAEARGILERYGPLDMLAATNVPNRQGGGMSQAMFVRFAYYLDCRDALHLFDNARGGYNIFMAPSLEPRFSLGRDGTKVVRSFAPPRSAVDQKSVYVGNLPEGVEKADIEQFFGDFGQVVNANVIRKVYDGDVINNFAFVEFAHPHEAMRAASGEHYFHGIKLRVEAKEYSARHQARVVAPTVGSKPVSGRNSYFDSSAQLKTDGRAFDRAALFNARGGQQAYSHAHPANMDVYNPMTPPAGIQYAHQGMQGNYYGTPYPQAMNQGFGLVTPPNQDGMQLSMNQMVPAGIFSPPQSHMVDGGYGYQGVPFGTSTDVYHAPNYYMPQTIPTIEESGEEGQY